MEKQWKPIEGYEGSYEVSNFGEVKSLERLDSRGRHRKEKLLKPQKNSKDYLFVRLSKNGVEEPILVHRLVWQTFVGEIPPEWEINHLDENKENNHLENLEACSHEKNINWGTRNAKVAATLKGKKRPDIAAALSKAVEAINKVTGRVVYVFPSTAEAGRQGFHQGAVAKCCRGELKSHGGFIWRYKDDIYINNQ